jgi:enamine deaminase RidA (YjgF/YER057c/UK114 family)
VNEVYAAYFQTPPARSTVLVNGWGDRERLIEVEAIAGLP